jgi:23S rRNA U2552 (ribose-2'-O)-methylase RlmE/FtsJ
MKRYQIRAYKHDRYSLELNAEQLFDIIEEHTSSKKAVDRTQELFAQQSSNKTYSIYNYSHLVCVDIKTDELLEGFEFDTTYITQTRAEELLDDAINNTNEPVVILDSSYQPANVLRNVDPYLYVKLLDTMLAANNLVVV